MANEEPEYLKFVRSQPCAMAGNGPCSGEMHAHHPQGGKGMGTRNHDSRAIPLCAKHHTERHSLSGAFKAYDKRRVREFEAQASERLRRQYLGLGELSPVDF